MAATYFLEWLKIIKYRIASKPRRPTVAVKYAGDFDEIPRISSSEAIGIGSCFFLPSTYGSPTTFRSLSKYSLPRKAMAKVIATAIPSAVHIHILPHQPPRKPRVTPVRRSTEMRRTLRAWAIEGRWRDEPRTRLGPAEFLSRARPHLSLCLL